ncbi:MAG TPA: hypothetical protein VK487_07090 [Candidatus Bathyarchaeia archaeon]|nr:hypothetical protein [Candidatus Bathyarchaeia archaeon]
MDSRAIAAIIIFSAVAIMLSLSPLKVPAPFALFLTYQIWEIPIVAAFLLYGSKVGIAVSFVNTIALVAIFPGALITGPLYDLIAVLSMLFGVYIIRKASLVFGSRLAGNGYFAETVAYVMLAMVSVIGALVQTFLWFLPACIFGALSIMVMIESRRSKNANLGTLQNRGSRYNSFLATTSTVSGAFMRVIAMTLVNFVVLPLSPPIGLSLPREAVITLLPLIGLFNATLAAYTIPIGYAIARVVYSRIRIAT